MLLTVTIELNKIIVFKIYDSEYYILIFEWHIYHFKFEYIPISKLY